MGHVGAIVGVNLLIKSVGQAEEGVEFVRVLRVESVASIVASTGAYFAQCGVDGCNCCRRLKAYLWCGGGVALDAVLFASTGFPAQGHDIFGVPR